MTKDAHLNEIAKLAAESILGTREGETTYVMEHVAKVTTPAEARELNRGFREMFDLDCEVRRLVKDAGGRMDSTEWYGAAMGLPWNCPFVFRRGEYSLGELALQSPVRLRAERRDGAHAQVLMDRDLGPEDDEGWRFQLEIGGEARWLQLERSGQGFAVILEIPDGDRTSIDAVAYTAPYGEWMRTENRLPGGEYWFLATLGEPYASAARVRNS